MYKPIFYKRNVLHFRHFTRRGYALFSVLGKEVLVGVLAVSTLTYAKAEGMSTRTTANADTTQLDRMQAIGLGEVVVTGSRAPLTAGQSARMVTVLNREAIGQAPVQSVNDLLKYAVGVDVRQRGPIGAQTDIGIRGGNYEQMAILLNGINIGDPQTGHNGFDFPVDLSEIERIEVLEGPAARVYGTSSLLGAINIITRTPSRSSAEARLEGGSFGYLSAALRGNLSKGRWNNQLSGSYTHSDGYTRSTAGSLNSDYQGGKAFYQGNYSDENIRVWWWGGLSTKGFGSNTFYGYGSDDQYEHTLKTYTAVKAETLLGRVHLRPAIYWNRHHDRFEYFRGQPDKSTYNYTRTDVFGLNLNAWFDWQLGRTALGAEIRNEDLVSTSLGEPLSKPKDIHGTDRQYTLGLNRTNVSFILEHNILLRNFTASLGLIATKNSWAEMSMKVYPGVDLGYNITRRLKAFASWNTSLRMPSATELYYKKDNHLADKNLKPEEVNALEVGLRYGGEAVTAKVSYYHNHYKNLIDWIFDTNDEDAAWKSLNYGKIDANGVETSLAFDLLRMLPSQKVLRHLDLSYNYINQDKREPEGVKSLYALEYLRHKFTANLRMVPLRNVWLSMNLRWQDRVGQYTTREKEVFSYSPYAVLDARLSWQRPRWELYLQANNITCNRYVDYGSVPQPGFWFTAGAKLRL